MTYEGFISPQKNPFPKMRNAQSLKNPPPSTGTRVAAPRPGRRPRRGVGWELAMCNQVHWASSVVGRIIYPNDIKAIKFANLRERAPPERTTVPFVELP